jgi:hypothetical protein
MKITWNKETFRLFLEWDTYWFTTPKGEYILVGPNITDEKAIERFFILTYTYTYGGVGRILT